MLLSTLTSLRKVLIILRRLMIQKYVTLPDLSEALGRSERQVRRYLEVLDDAGFRLENDAQGRIKSFVRLAQQFPREDLLFLLSLTSSELVLLHLQTVGVHHVGNPEVKDSLLSKLRGAIEQKELNWERITRGLVGFEKAYKSYDKDEFRGYIATLVCAIYAVQTCQVTYHTPDGDAPRTYRIEPYTLFQADGGLYLFCRVPRFNQVRMLAVERIKALKTNNEIFEREDAVMQEIEDKKNRAFRIIDEGEPIPVKLRFSPEAAFYVNERKWHGTQPEKLEKTDDGGVILTFQASGRFEIVRWIMWWGPEVEVLEPPDLREEVRGKLAEAAEIY